MTWANDTAAAVIADLKSAPPSGRAGHAGLRELLDQRGQECVTFDGWRAIQAQEQRDGLSRGKPSEKLVSVERMVQIATGS